MLKRVMSKMLCKLLEAGRYYWAPYHDDDPFVWFLVACFGRISDAVEKSKNTENKELALSELLVELDVILKDAYESINGDDTGT